MNAEPTTDPAGAEPKRLLVARHAKSSWDDPSLADHDRPLAPRGRKAVERLRLHLEAVHGRPDVVVCSSSRRTRDTLEGILPALGHPDVEIDPALYGASAGELLGRLRRLDEQVGSVLVIGHNPGVADLTDLLVAPSARAPGHPDRFPTGALASLSVRGPWADLAPAGASLASFWTPRRRSAPDG